MKLDSAATFRLCEIRENNGRNGRPSWIIIKGAVYDVTDFLKKHPGGTDVVLEYCGRDATKAFAEVGHSSDAVRQLNSYKIGIVSNECIARMNDKPDNGTSDIITSEIRPHPPPAAGAAAATLAADDDNGERKQNNVHDDFSSKGAEGSKCFFCFC